MPISPSGPTPRRLGPEFEYEPVEGLFDEALTSAGEIRGHWEPFFEQLDRVGVSEIRRRWDESRQLIRENGVTYNVYGDPNGMDRPWELDPLPMLVSPEDARTLERGLIQRARLLDAILGDLYGPQRLLREGVLPVELVHGNPGFLRPCHGIELPTGRRLHLYAADVGRTRDGAFRVLRDRTQAPSGAGYALENRIVQSRMWPEAFRDCGVRRLAPFFQAVRELLRSIAPRNRDNPRVVLLTPGPFNETYFEHAFLARYLGYTLVEGADLTVRGDQLYLKLLGGLQAVDVVVRRLDDDYCDPLELRGDSFLGVPGLVQAVRSGNVAVANALGSGLLETPALAAFLPSIAQFLLGEDLEIASVATWWCGDPASLAHVLENLESLVIKPTFPSGRSASVFCERLPTRDRELLAAKLRNRPRDFIAQETLCLGTSPISSGDRFEARRSLFRANLAARGDTYIMMPGGMTRIAPDPNSIDVSMQKGGGSKDTWFVSSEPVAQFSLLPTTVEPVEVRRDGGDVPSRAADDLYWLGRYTERSEGLVRLIRAVLVRLTERSADAESPELPGLLRAVTLQTGGFPGFVGEGAEQRLAAPAEEILSLIHDRSRTGGLACTLDTLHRVASRVRDRISIDMWRTIVGLDLQRRRAPSRRSGTAATSTVPTPDTVSLARPRTRRALAEALDLLDQEVLGIAAFSGMVAESMTRGQGRRFLEMGRRIERSLHTLGLIRATLVSPAASEAPMLEALLEIADSLMTYRRRYLSRLQTIPVLDLILIDPDNPRSLAFQIRELSMNIGSLPRTEDAPASNLEQAIISQVVDRIASLDLAALESLGEDGTRGELDRFLRSVETELPILSDALTRTYLTHLQAARHFSRAIEPEPTPSGSPSPPGTRRERS